jgi:hypothetical protein
MTHDLIYTPKVIDEKCYQCDKIFKLYEIQKMPMNFCGVCAINKKLTELTTLPLIIKKIVEYAEKQDKRINDRLIVDIENLVQDLQIN